MNLDSLRNVIRFKNSFSFFTLLAPECLNESRSPRHVRCIRKGILGLCLNGMLEQPPTFCLGKRRSTAIFLADPATFWMDVCVNYHACARKLIQLDFKPNIEERRTIAQYVPSQTLVCAASSSRVRFRKKDKSILEQKAESHKVCDSCLGVEQSTIRCTMRLRVVAAAAACRLLLATPVQADRDDTYYPAGVRNPLVQQDLYYKDATNVLEDLDAFESLFVKYHSCTYVFH